MARPHDPAVDEAGAESCGPGILVDALTTLALPAASRTRETGMSDDIAALLLTLAAENAELREQLAAAQDMLVETAIDPSHLHDCIEAVQVEQDAWRAEAERLHTDHMHPGVSISPPGDASHDVIR